MNPTLCDGASCGERRSAERAPTKATAIVTTGSKRRASLASVVDLGRGGIGFESSGLLARPGDVVRATFRLAEYRMWFEGYGELVRFDASRGAIRWTAFAPSMRGLREHLIRCARRPAASENMPPTGQAELETNMDYERGTDMKQEMAYMRERGAIRRAAKLDCQIVRERDFRLVAERALNVSTEGMLVRADGDVEIGDQVIVSFRLDPLGIWIDADATVARIVAGRRQGDSGRAFGLRFTSLGAIRRHILRGALRKVPPPVPARPARVDYARTIMNIFG